VIYRLSVCLCVNIVNFVKIMYCVRPEIAEITKLLSSELNNCGRSWSICKCSRETTTDRKNGIFYVIFFCMSILKMKNMLMREHRIYQTICSWCKSIGPEVLHDSLCVMFPFFPLRARCYFPSLSLLFFLSFLSFFLCLSTISSFLIFLSFLIFQYVSVPHY
jgi:hypothetical protein